MSDLDPTRIAAAKNAALEILLHNLHGPYHGLPRTAGWGYPEPYTRDLMIASLGILVSGHPRLIKALEKVLVMLAKNQSELGHIPSLAHDPEDRGASDTTPLFLMGVGLYREATDQPLFLNEAVDKALTDLVCQAREAEVAFGFNEWHRAQDGTAQGQDWQTWSAAMYLYAAACVEQEQTPFFAVMRKRSER